jgi:hypothetical protein
MRRGQAANPSAGTELTWGWGRGAETGALPLGHVEGREVLLEGWIEPTTCYMYVEDADVAFLVVGFGQRPPGARVGVDKDLAVAPRAVPMVAPKSAGGTGGRQI